MPHHERPGRLSGSRRLRPLLVAITAPAAAAGLHAALLPDLVATVTASPSPDFATLLETGAALALLLSSLWLAAVTVLVVAQAVGAPGRRVPSLACPSGVRRAVLAACGLTLATGLLTPATAAPPEPVWPPGPSPEILAEDAPGTAPRARLSPLWDLDGLPLPDRITRKTSTAARPLPAPPEGTRARGHRVVPGDTLWSVARDDLPASASAAEVSRHWQRIHRHNRAEIGPDPDLIHPGLLLRLPPTTTGKAAP